jgi:ddrB-like ParB superfamily domain
MPIAYLSDIDDAGAGESGGTVNASDIVGLAPLTPDAFMAQQRSARPATNELTPDAFMAAQPVAAPRGKTVNASDIVGVAPLTPDSFMAKQATPASFVADDPLDSKPKTAADLPSRETFEAAHKAAAQSVWDQVKSAASLVPTILSGTYPKAQQLWRQPAVPESVMPPPAKTVPGAIARSALEFARGMTSPENISLGALMGPVAKIAPLLTKAVGAGFGVQMMKTMVDQVPEVRDAVQKKDWPRAASAITTAALSGGLGAMAGAHAVRGVERPASATSVSVREAPEGAGPTPPATGANSSMGDEPRPVNLPPSDPMELPRVDSTPLAADIAGPAPAEAVTPDSFLASQRQTDTARTPAPQAATPDSFMAEQAQSAGGSRGQRVPIQVVQGDMTRAEYADLKAKLRDEHGDLGFDTTKQAVDAIATHPDWAHRWDVQDPELVRLGNKLGGWPSQLEAPQPAETEGVQPERQPAPDMATLSPRVPSTPPAYGRDVAIAVPGEQTSYPGKYAVRELADVQASHNAFSFEPNPAYEHVNDRDYSRTGNAARVVKNSSSDVFNPDFLTTDAPTAEHGAPVVDANGNALGGNSRAMSLARVYGRGGPDASMYRDAIESKAQQFGIDPDELARFDKPVLVRELGGGVDAQRAITDFNKAAAAELTPEERAVSDGRRLSDQTVQEIGARLGDSGEEGTLADALRGDDGATLLSHLVRDGVLTEQEQGGYLDDRGFLTPEAKARVAKALVGRLFDTPAEFRDTTPAMRGKLERVAPQVLRVEGRPDWSITDTLRQALALSEDARVHKMPIEEAARQSVIGEQRSYSPDAIGLAKTLEQGPVKAATAFRRYANDEALSRGGSQGAFFTPPTRAESFADAFQAGKASPETPRPKAAPAGASELQPAMAGERGAVDITPMAEALQRKFPEAIGGEPRSNYSGLGAARDKFIRNLSQLEEASPEAHAAAVRAASSRAQSAALLRSAMPRIEEALGSDVAPADFRRALIQGRLEGLRQRWSEMAADPRSAFANDPDRPARLMELLGNIEGKRGLPQDLRQTAAALMERSDVPTLESFLRETFSDAASSVARVMDAGEFERIRGTPGFERGLAAYKQLLEQPLAENHALNEGVFSDALGPLKTYYPLVPLKESEAVMARAASRPAYGKPRNIANEFATGLAGQYDPGVAALGDRIAAALRSNNRAALIDTLEQEGLLHRLGRGEEPGDAIEIGGQAYRASVVETAPSRTIVKEGRFVSSPAEKALVPEWLDKELAPILAAKDLRIKVGLAQHLSDAITALSLFGPTDISAHANNLLGTLVANTPFVGRSFLSLPFMKRFTATVKILSTDPATPEAAGDLTAMARLGLLPDRYASETWSKKAAEQLGAHRTFTLGPLLYGPKGLDVRARLVMYRLAKELNPDATPLQMYKFVNQLGNYTRQLQSEIERSAKASGMAPFFTAGSQMVRNGVNAFLGTGPMPKSGAGVRIAQQLTGGAVGVVATWVAAYRAYTGQFPWDDKRAKFLKIPVNEGDRRSWLGRKMWGDGPETGYVDFGFFNPLVARGARALGVSQSFDTARAGGNARQIREAAATGPINAVTHPFLGPPARALFVGVTGQSPWLSGLRDREGRPGLQLLPADTKASSFPHLGAALREVSGVQGRLGEATGFLPATGMPERGNPYFRMVADLALPGLFAQASNVPGKAAALARERKSVDKAAAHEQQQRAVR